MTVEVLEKVYKKYFQMVYRICFLYMKQEADALDMLQDTFIKLFESGFYEEDEKRMKAWLIVTASNTCKSGLRRSWRKKRDVFDENRYENQAAGQEVSREVLQTVLAMEDKYKLVTYLYYFEGYTTSEIGRMLHINASTVQTRLAKARKLLKEELE